MTGETANVVTALGPLAGVQVMDLTVNVLGPVATQSLGDMGADVIKVETPRGDPHHNTGPSRSAGMSATHMNVNRNKRSISLHLKHTESLEAIMRLAFLPHTRRLPPSASPAGRAYDRNSD